jgi:hypothetical protein
MSARDAVRDRIAGWREDRAAAERAARVRSS